MSERLADEFFWLAHDDTSGRPRLSAGVMGLGLSGALLAELLLACHITVEAEMVRLIAYQPPSDELTGALVELVRSERTAHPVRSWLAYLARDAEVRVGRRMVRSGQLQARRSRHLLHGAVSFVPTDWNTAAWAGARLRQQLSKTEPMAWPDVVLAGLSVACGLTEHVVWTGQDPSRAYLEHLIAALALLSPPLAAVLGEVQAAVGNAVLVHRA